MTLLGSARARLPDLRGPRRRSAARPRGEPELRLLHALAEAGCPICCESRRVDSSYFFWFFNESYYASFTLDALHRSLGFCLGHAEVLSSAQTGAAQLAYVHHVLVRRVRLALAADAAGQGGRRPPRGPTVARSGPCPACHSRAGGADRNVSWLAGILEDPALFEERYGRPGMLCVPHLRALAPRVSDAAFGRLLAAHGTAMTAALEELPAGRPGGSRGDLLERVLPALHLAVGHDTELDPYPSPDEAGSGERARDPVAELAESLRRDCCPLCLEVRRAWLEWTAWLDAASSRGEPQLADLLPTCAEHVWPLVRHGRPPLAAAVARRALGAALVEVDMARGALLPRPRPERERLTERLHRILREPRRRVEAARDVLARGLRCPVCERLAVARDRALALLLALLADRRHRAAFADGYGLCIAHLAQALAWDPKPETRRLLVEVEDARLASLEWELAEAMRKTAWQFRPEAKGAEQTAWRRALLRFSGSLR